MTPILSIEFIEDTNWLGGAIYIDNLLSSLSLLPASTRPLIRLKFLSSAGTPLAKRLQSYPVIHSSEKNNLLGNLTAKVRRTHRAIVRRWPTIGRLYKATDQELFFPVFDTSQYWRKNLYWIPDFQPHYLPELFDSAELSSRLQSFSRIAKSHGILLLSSRAALSDFRKFYPLAKIEPRVWSFTSGLEVGPVADCLETLSRYKLPEKYLYIANQFWRHKDHSTAFEALAILRDKGMIVPIVCTGLQNDRRAPTYFESLIKNLERNGLRNQVFFLGVVPREDQIQIFRGAAAVVQPSRFEGWSTVLEDAKALGRPIIASDTAVHQEQLSDLKNISFFSTSDASDLADRLAMMWPDLRKGPAPNLELLAANRRDEIRLESAHKFLTIIQEALSYPMNRSKDRKLQ